MAITSYTTYNVITAYTPFTTFLVGLVMSVVIMVIAVKLFGEQEGFGTWVLAVFISAVVYAFSFYFFGGIIASLIWGMAWLAVLGSLYKMGWTKASIIAALVWLLSTLVFLMLPTQIAQL